MIFFHHDYFVLNVDCLHEKLIMDLWTETKKIYVVLFTQRIDPDVRTRIRKYIQQNLQVKMDTELK